MVSALLVLILVSVIVYKCLKFMFDRPPNFPPALPKIPIFGSYLFILAVNYNHVYKAFQTFGRWYGTSQLGFHYGATPVIAVLDLATTKEVLNNPDLDGRPVFPIVTARDPNFNVFGIFFRDGLFWRSQRRFALRHLRDFGFGRRFDELEIHIDEELRELVDLIKGGPKYSYEKKFVNDNGLVLLPSIFSLLPANVFLKCALNERFSRKDLEDVFRAGEASFAFQRAGCMFGRMFSVIESVKYIIPNWSGYNAVRDSSMAIHGIMEKIVAEQYKTYDPAHERHFVDLYFQQIAEDKEHFSLEQITHIIVDFMFPALSAPSTAITLMVQRLLLNPECMDQCQRQIDEVVGRGRLASLDDRVKLPFVDAMIRESLRLDTLVPNNVPHQAFRDTKVGRYDLPKGGLVLTVLSSAHRDEKHFKDATLYKPERFLDADGQLDLKLDSSVPFGAGKRLCAGETFSRNIMFLIVCTILQNFTITVPDGHSLPNPDINPPRTGLNTIVKDFYLKFTSR